jgi:hypothetical protein
MNLDRQKKSKSRHFIDRTAVPTETRFYAPEAVWWDEPALPLDPNQILRPIPRDADVEQTLMQRLIMRMMEGSRKKVLKKEP